VCSSDLGHHGIKHFIETTIGFGRRIIMDRHEPLYPRAIKPGDDLSRLFDDTLQAAGVRFEG